MSKIYVDEIAGIASANTVAIPGHVIQVVQAVKTDVFNANPGTQWANIAGLSASITPSSTTSKILVMLDLKGAGNAGSSVVRSRVLRDTTPIYVGDAASNRPRGWAQFYIGNAADNIFYMAQLGGSYVDSPATTSAVTYTAQIGGDANDRPVRVNQTQGDRDLTYYDTRVASSLILMEIAG